VLRICSSRSPRAAAAVGSAATVAVAAVLAFASGPATAAPGGGHAVGSTPVNSDASTTSAQVDASSAIVTLTGDPLSTAASTRPPHGKKIDFSSSTVKAERARLSALRNDFKTWLRANAPAASVVKEYDTALNAVAVRLNGTTLATLRSAPQVTDAQYERLYSPSDDTDPDLGLISAQQAWRTPSVGGPADAGKGVKIGIIDTGIDVRHPCFSDAGFPATKQLGDARFTNNKVIVAKVFANKAANLGLTAEAVQDHGTHVAGTAACDLDTPAVVNGADIPYQMSGVAPAAQLGNYNIFPGDILNARSEDIVDALEAAYFDGMDVVNMSLGGASSGALDVLTKAVDDLDIAGMVSAVAAGNSGPGHFTVESPGSAERALSAGASTVGHFVASPLTVGGRTFAAVSGDFPTVTTDLTAPLGVVAGTTNGLGLACTALPAGSLTGKIAVVSRGSCSFSLKIRNAQDAGAVATIVVNNVAGDPIALGTDATVQPAPTIPAYMVALTDAAAMVAANGQSATIGVSSQYFRSGNDDIMAAFSSQGPTDASFRRVKPDVVAPGVNVLSSIPLQFCGTGATSCFAFFQGTSMATPHLAGMAAVVIDAARARGLALSAEQVRSAVVNTADEGVLKSSADATTLVTDVNITGAGRGDLAKAVAGRVAIGPVSTSFGSVPGGSGQTRTATVTLSSLTGTAVTVTPLVDTVVGSGVTFSVPAAPVTVPATGSVTVTVTAAVARGAAAGDHSAILRLSAGGTEVAHSVLYAFVV
jgi:minor extracellular serine protease Vpr